MKFRYDASLLHEAKGGSQSLRSDSISHGGFSRTQVRSELNGAQPRAFTALRRHWGKSLLFLMASIGLILAALVLAPRKYSSQAKLFVRIGRESVGLDPTATTGETISLQRENEVELNSIVELLRSRGLMELVVDSLGPDRLLKEKETGAAVTTDGPWQIVKTGLNQVKGIAGAAIGWVKNLDPISERDQAIHKLHKSLEVTIPKHSSVVSVSYTATSPQLAHDIVEALVAEYLNEHRRVNQTDGAYEFFRDQSAMAREELAKANQEFSDVKVELGVLSADLQRDLLHQQRSENELQRGRVDADLAAAESRVASLTELLEPLTRRIDSDKIAGHDNVAADGMRAQLYNLEVKKAELLAQYQADHPLVIAMEKQLADARQVYEQQPVDRSRATSTVNPTYQQLELELLTERGNVAALSSQLAKLEDQRQELLAQVSDLNRQSIRLGDMERQIEVLGSEYRSQLAKLEQSRINEALGQRRISNVNIAQPASLVAKPVSPNKPMVLLLGMAIAFGGAFLLPFWFERRGDFEASTPVKPPSQPVTIAAERSQTPESPPRKPVSTKQPVSV